MPKIIKSVDIPATELKSGDVLFQEGTAGDAFGIVKKGTVTIYKNYGKPNQIELATLSEGKVVGELSALDGQPRTATAVASTDATIVKIPSNSLKYQLEQCPQWFQAIILDLVGRLRTSSEVLAKSGLTDPVSGHSDSK